jgi:methionine biosynthesis protein MetW
MTLRTDMQIISEWVAPGSRVLDLGCGDGTLLKHLMTTRQVNGYGIEIDSRHVVESLDAGINVIQSDLDAGLSDFDEESFDCVIMTQTLQAVHYPERLLEEMLRVGREGIVTFPNFGHWRSRLQLALGGRMPKTPALPSEWYNTENIHLCTLIDFERLCRTLNIKVLQRTVVDHTHRTSFGMRVLPNLLGEVAIYRFKRN